MLAKLVRKRFISIFFPGEKELVGDMMTYWRVNPTEAQRLVGITMGNLPSQ